MQKIKSIYVCSECGHESSKWYGQCPACGSWNSMNEEICKTENKISSTKKNRLNLSDISSPSKIDDITIEADHRDMTGLNELDRVLGGGLVKGSLLLIGGAPGIGKSTLLLQICDYLSKKLKVLYISGEESKHQLQIRAKRLGVTAGELYFMAETDVGIILETIKCQKPNVVIIDSIQTMSISELNSSPGSVTQVRESTNAFRYVSKSLNISTIIVGHVNKDGAIAGPKVMEHIVDTVLYFEGDKQLSYRVLRAIKNRYGSTNEIGVFDMLDDGLKEIENPSMLLLSGRPINVSGSCVTCIMEGTRPILAEVQGLASVSVYGTPRRMSTGFDYNRLSLLLAVMEKKAGYYFNNVDTYVNVIGGIKLDEPAADLSVSLALLSSLKDKIVADDTVVFGEIGLTGEIRTVSHVLSRVKEAERMGFSRCILPEYSLSKLGGKHKLNIKLVGVKTLRQAFDLI